MSDGPFRTVLVGFGRIGAGYADDPVMARHYRYATHAQALKEHPAFAWDAVVDLSEEARKVATDRWGIPIAERNLHGISENYEPEVAVIATGPEDRIETIQALPTVRAVVVEKPLGITEAASRNFLELCRKRGILVQVNLWRRADPLLVKLSRGLLQAMAGEIQCAFGIYGNGLINNGTHMIDFVRMLLGEVDQAGAVGPVKPYFPGPIAGDVNVAFVLRMRSGVSAMMHPVDFAKYRENSLDLWGAKGRLAIMQEGLAVTFYPVRENRAMGGEKEVASDQPQELASTVGEALYHLYDNLAHALREGTPLLSPGESAMETTRIVQSVLDSIE